MASVLRLIVANCSTVMIVIIESVVRALVSVANQANCSACYGS
jgi:hypothetical protein